MDNTSLTFRRIIRSLVPVLAFGIVVAITSGMRGECQGSTAGQSLTTPAAEKDRWASKPTSYVYNQAGGTLDDQSRAAVDAGDRAAAIAGHGRSGDHSGLYAIAALLLLSASLVIWRRSRARA